VSIKGSQVRGWIPAKYYWEAVEPLRMKPCEKLLRSFGVCPGSKKCNPSPFLFHYFTSWSLGVKEWAPSMMCHVTIALKATEPIGHRMEPPKLWTKINLISVNWLPQVFANINCKLTQHVLCKIWEISGSFKIPV
jgi:hypothetical protein